MIKDFIFFAKYFAKSGHTDLNTELQFNGRFWVCVYGELCSSKKQNISVWQ